MSQFAQIHYIKWHTIWLTLSTYHPINQECCPPLGTTSLGQAVYKVFALCQQLQVDISAYVPMIYKTLQIKLTCEVEWQEQPQSCPQQ